MVGLVSGLGGARGFGEGILTRNDDGSTGALDLTGVFENGLDLFGTTYTSFFVNNNGSVTFGGPRSTFTPDVITGVSENPEITPFFADIDTRMSMVGPAQPASLAPTPGGNSTGSNLVWYDFDTANDRIVVTWDDVGFYFQDTTKLNAFQLILIDEGDGDFDIEFRYEDVNWTTGDASGGTDGLGGTVARAGWTAGTGEAGEFFELPASGDEAAVLALDETAGNTGQAGRWFFAVRDGAVVDAAIPPGPAEPCVASSFGDPHMRSFDGLAWDFMAAGEFVLAREIGGPFEVQARMEPVNPGSSVSWNTAAATRLGDAVVMLDVTDPVPLHVNGVPTQLGDFQTLQAGNGLIGREGDTYTIVYPGDDGVVNAGDERTVITLYDRFLNVRVELDPDRALPVEGLLGSCDGNAANDIAFDDGTPLVRPVDPDILYGAFADDWRVGAGGTGAGGAVELTLSDNTNVPTFTLKNTGTLAIDEFTFTIGDTTRNFDSVEVVDIQPGGLITIDQPDTGDDGVRSDAIGLRFTSFDPGEEAVWRADVDPDNANVGQDFTQVFYNNGAAPNSVATVTFADDSELQFTLDDRPAGAIPQTFTAGTGGGVTLATSFDFGGSTYYVYVSPDALSWTEARALAQGLGVDLAAITSEAENDAVAAAIADLDSAWSTFAPTQQVGPWIGASDAAAEGSFSWVTGEGFDYANWAAGEPNNAGNNEHYVHFTSRTPPGAPREAEWNDITLSGTDSIVSFVAERPPIMTLDAGQGAALTMDGGSLFTYDAGESQAGFNAPGGPDSIITYDDLEPNARAAAESQAIAAGLEPGTANFRDAVLDLVMTGETDVLDAALAAPMAGADMIVPLTPGPAATDDTATVSQFVARPLIDVLSDDTQPEGEDLTVVEVTRPANGGAFVNADGTVGYASNRFFTGTDRFEYVVEDETGQRDRGAVEVSVTAADPDLLGARLIAYLYEAGLDRDGNFDIPGLNFWIDELLVVERSQRAIAEDFLESQEFEDNFGEPLETDDPDYLDDFDFVTALYENVLDRTADDGGRNFWLSVLDQPGVDRTDLLILFAESPENVYGSPVVANLAEIAPGEWDFLVA